MRINQGPRYLTREIVEELGGIIVRGDAPAGENLPIEAELSEKFNASRTVVREAIKMLTAKGLVGSRPRRGTYVEPVEKWNILDPDVLRWTLQRRFSLQLVREFLTVRQAIEPAAAAEAARRQNVDKISKIAESLEDMRAAEKGDKDPLLADIRFHLSLLEASENRFFVQFSSVVDTALRFSIRAQNRAKGVQTASVRDHEIIYEAIRKGNAKKAAQNVISLLQEAQELIDSLAETETETKTVATAAE